MIFVFLLLMYYWYLYFHRFKRVEKPTTARNPPPSYTLEFSSEQPSHFQFVLNGNKVWEHTLPPNTFTFHENKIVEIDPCHGIGDGEFVTATGKSLYDRLMRSPTVATQFKENSQHMLQNGKVFYFVCSKGRVDQLKMCPSGTMLSKNACKTIGLCTDKPDGTLFPHKYLTRYIRCKNGREHVRECNHNYIFYHNRCESIQELSHYCKMHPNKSFKFNDNARVECRDGKTVYVKCKDNSQFFDKDYCEPSVCVGKADGEKISLHERRAGVFRYIPGYITCLDDKIHETVECPQSWNESEIRDDDLSFLPMVFDGRKCSVPQFCKNVISTDRNTIVPVYEFTKNVKNWKFSRLLDDSVGYICDQGVRKRKTLPPDVRISKRFKEAPACESNLKKLLVRDDENSYYDCDLKSKVLCPPNEFFNGSQCVSKPKNAFSYQNFPLFEFDSLNKESWIKAFQYSNDTKVQCVNPYLFHPHNICTHPDCSLYAFVSQIPDLAVLLPLEKRAKCKFYEDEKILKKEPVDFDYDYWSQGLPTKEFCRPGQRLRTGNFIWDSTVFATCDEKQPFVFCPSNSGRGIDLVNGEYWACQPPEHKQFKFDSGEWASFERNEIKRILPATQKPTRFRRTKATDWENLLDDGLYYAEGDRLTLRVSEPVNLEVRYRVSHPPNVAFRYDNDGSVHPLTNTPEHVFLIGSKGFTKLLAKIPRYKPIIHVASFGKNLYV